MAEQAGTWPGGEPGSHAAAWLGIDLGTSAVKACVLGGHGRVLATARAALPDRGSGAGAADWLEAAVAAVRRLGPATAAVSGIGLCGLTPSLVLTDDTGQPLRAPMTWADTEAAGDATALARHFGPAGSDLLGVDLPWTAGYPPAQLRWLSRTEPSVLARARWALQVKDYVGFQLTGTAVSDAWSSKGLCRADDGTPAEAVLRFAGAGTQIVPPMRPPWASRGGLLPGIAGRLGLTAGLPVTVGWSDALAAMLALGAFHRRGSFALTGTSGIAGFSGPQFPVSSAAGLLRVAPPITPQPLVYGPTQNGGSVLQWLAALTGTPAGRLADLAAEAALAATPVMVPFLDGERAPIWRPDVTATVSRLTSATGLPELALAAMTGMAATLRSVVEAASAAPGDAVVIGGRHLTHPAWQRAFGAIFPAGVLLADAELPALGAAQIAALGAGTAVTPQYDVAALPAGRADAGHYAAWLAAREQVLTEPREIPA